MFSFYDLQAHISFFTSIANDSRNSRKNKNSNSGHKCLGNAIKWWQLTIRFPLSGKVKPTENYTISSSSENNWWEKLYPAPVIRYSQHLSPFSDFSKCPINLLKQLWVGLVLYWSAQKRSYQNLIVDFYWQNNLFVPHKMPEWPPPLYNCVLLLLGVFSLWAVILSTFYN